MKILHLITSVQLGGAETVVFNLVKMNSCQPSTIEYSIAEVYSSKTEFAKHRKAELSCSGFNIVSLSSLPKRLAMFVSPVKLLMEFRKCRYDIIHSHTDIPDFVLSVFLRLCKWNGTPKPRIVRTIHNTALWPSNRRVAKFTEGGIEDDAVIAVSQGAALAYKHLREKNNLRSAIRLKTIFNGVPSPERKCFPDPLLGRKISFLFCGRFEYQKGIDIWINAIFRMNENIAKKCSFWFIGDGSEIGLIRKLLGKKENVYLSPPIPRIADFLHNFDYLVMPSRFEGLPLLAIESALAGTPVIASRAPGLEEALPSNWPMLIDFAQHFEVENLIGDLLSEKYDRNALSACLKGFAEKKFSMQAMALAYIEVYREVGGSTIS